MLWCHNFFHMLPRAAEANINMKRECIVLGWSHTSNMSQSFFRFRLIKGPGVADKKKGKLFMIKGPMIGRGSGGALALYGVTSSLSQSVIAFAFIRLTLPLQSGQKFGDLCLQKCFLFIFLCVEWAICQHCLHVDLKRWQCCCKLTDDASTVCIVPWNVCYFLHLIALFLRSCWTSIMYIIIVDY